MFDANRFRECVDRVRGWSGERRRDYFASLDVEVQQGLLGNALYRFEEAVPSSERRWTCPHCKASVAVSLGYCACGEEQTAELAEAAR